MFNKHVKTFQYGNQTVTLETGEIARQAAGFQSNGLITVLEGLNVFIEHHCSFQNTALLKH